MQITVRHEFVNKDRDFLLKSLSPIVISFVTKILEITIESDCDNVF